MLEGMEVQFHQYLTSALDGYKRSTSRYGHFNPQERAPGTHWKGGWVGTSLFQERMHNCLDHV